MPRRGEEGKGRSPEPADLAQPGLRLPLAPSADGMGNELGS
jgi:hypothetical protein